MKALFILALLASPVAFAAPNEENFAERKAKMIANLDEGIAKAQEAKACAEKATDGKALQECRKGLMDFFREKREEMKEHRKERSRKH